ncbi:MAG TPA: M23 family metallopeptidase [Flavobacterium sp.]|jgi:murein DD-endopeptidase MepM/ murein hydrolase activator NlpD
MKKRLYFLILAVITFAGCSKITQLTDNITNPSARERYAREFKESDVLFGQWRQAYHLALSDSIEVQLPYVESGSFKLGSASAYSYVLQMKEGEVIEASVERDSTSHRIFIDIYKLSATGSHCVEQSEIGASQLSHAVEESGGYKVIIQPEIAANTNFNIVLSKAPLYGFPVAGKGNSAIQSFWGYERDGGARRHEGVDIFAKKGTPVIAVSDGVISDTGDRGLGGKQVWQRTENFRHAIYYAHLDQIKATTGSRVKIGDTVGFVGNTGNAKGGPAHLHFGIYKYGAVDPLPFIYATKTPKTAKPKGFSKQYQSVVVSSSGSAANLRQAPSTSAPTLGTIRKSENATLLGEHGDWLHIRTARGTQAFLHKSAARAI